MLHVIFQRFAHDVNENRQQMIYLVCCLSLTHAPEHLTGRRENHDDENRCGPGAPASRTLRI